MSINKLISLNHVITEVLDFIGLDKSREKPVFMTWAENAEKRIGGSGALKRKRAVIDVNGCSVCLPAYIHILERAIMGDHGCDCDDLFNSTFSKTNSTITGDTDNFLIIDLGDNEQINGCSVPYDIQDNKLILRKDYGDAKMTIQYTGYDTDKEGFLIVSENHKEAIVQFILWQYGKRSRFGVLQQARLPYQDVKDAEMEWKRLCADARAKDAKLTPADRAEIAGLPSTPYTGRGLYVGMSEYPN